LIDAPAYGDRQVEAGKRYRYTVSSVDQAGNESARSEAVEATAQ
jgi:fibronectin type 3 domain-containing protein